MYSTDFFIEISYKEFHDMNLISYFFSRIWEMYSIFLGNYKNTFFLISDRVNWVLFFLVLTRSLIFLNNCYFSRPGKLTLATFGIFLVSR